MRIKTILAGACTVLLLLTTIPMAVPEAGAPLWQVGNSWAMGTGNIDLSPILTEFMENITSQIPGAQDVTYSASGNMGFYVIYRVENVDLEEYSVSLTENGYLTMSLDMSGTVEGQHAHLHAELSMVINIYGILHFTKEDLKLTKIEMTIENMSMVITGNITAGEYSQSLNSSFKAVGNINMTFNPPLNQFDFPIHVGDNWTINSTATVSGELTYDFVVPNQSPQHQSTPLSATMPISMSASCTGRKNITLPNGSTTNTYKINYSGESTGGANPFLGASTVYYSPDTGYIVSSEISLGNTFNILPQEIGQQTLSGIQQLNLGSIINDKVTMNPLSVEEAISGASGPRGDNTVLIIAIVAPVIVVVVVVTVFLFKRAVSI